MNYDLFGKIAVGWILGWIVFWVIFLLWPGSANRRPVLRFVYAHMNLSVCITVVIIIVPLAVGDFLLRDFLLEQSRLQHNALEKTFRTLGKAIQAADREAIDNVLHDDSKADLNKFVTELRAGYARANERDQCEIEKRTQLTAADLREFSALTYFKSSLFKAEYGDIHVATAAGNESSEDSAKFHYTLRGDAAKKQADVQKSLSMKRVGGEWKVVLRVSAVEKILPPRGE